MKSFVVLSRNFGDYPSHVDITEIEAVDREEAWEKVENEHINSNCDTWLLSGKEFDQLKEKITNYTYLER